MSRAPRLLVLALLLAGCARSGTQGVMLTSAGTGGATQDEAAVTATIAQALAAESAGESADSLYALGAVIVVNGRARSVSPYFAGIGTGGQTAITSSQMEIRSGLAWSLVEYRWLSREGVSREGRATLVLKYTPGGKWRITHVHSSSPR